MPPSRRRVLILTADTIGERRSGPAIRAWEMATALATEHDVVLATTGACSITGPAFECRQVDAATLPALVDGSDVVIMQADAILQYPAWAKADTAYVADLYDPFHLELLEWTRDDPFEHRQLAVNAGIEVLNAQIARADLMMCASVKQRDFWLGQMAGIGRINPYTYDHDETLERLITVVPFGVPAEPPVRTRGAIKGVVDGIDADDTVVLWGGGVYNWFDPLTLLRAIAKLRDGGTAAVKLFFLGMVHPHAGVPHMRVASEARALADELGLTGKHVFFNEEWVAYDDRQNYLLDADIGVSCHLDHVETQFSFRTRILDYFWAGLPVVATEGDTLSALVTGRGAGLAVPPGDVDALAEALGRLAADRDFAAQCRANSAAVAGELTWQRVLAPLADFCRDPHRAPDLVDSERIPPQPVRRRRGRAELLGRHALTVYRREGVPAVARRVAAKLARPLRRSRPDHLCRSNDHVW